MLCVRNDFRVATPGDGFRKAPWRKVAAGGTGGKYTGVGLRLARADVRTAATPAGAADAAAAGFGALRCGFAGLLDLGSFQGWWEILTREEGHASEEGKDVKRDIPQGEGTRAGVRTASRARTSSARLLGSTWLIIVSKLSDRRERNVTRRRTGGCNAQTHFLKQHHSTNTQAMCFVHANEHGVWFMLVGVQATQFIHACLSVSIMHQRPDTVMLAGFP